MDKIKIDILVEKKGDSSSFSGIGSEKYNLAWRLQTTFHNGFLKDLGPLGTALGTSNIKDSIQLNSKMDSLVSLIRRYRTIRLNLINKSKIDPSMRKVMAYEFGSYNGGFNYEWLFRCGLLYARNATYRNLISKNYNRYKDEFYESPDAIAIYCPLYITELVDRNIFELKIQSDTTRINFEDLYNRIINNYSGVVRERLIGYIFTHPKIPKICQPFSYFATSKLLEGELKIIETPYIKNTLKVKLSTLNKLGREPIIEAEFTTPNNQKFNINSLKGKIILIDTWFNGCYGCIGFHKYFEKIYPKFKNNKNFVVLSINVDKYKQRWIDGIKSKRYTSDGFINVTTGNWFDHPFMRYYNIGLAPYLMIVDSKGNILENTSINNLERQLKTALKDLGVNTSK